MILLAADGLENKKIAVRLGQDPGKVGRWRQRYVQMGLAGILKPVFDSFENAVTDNQRLTSAQGSVGTTSGSGGERMLRRFPGGRAGGRLRRRGWPEKHRP